jgi:hypothetical protein
MTLRMVPFTLSISYFARIWTTIGRSFTRNIQAGPLMTPPSISWILSPDLVSTGKGGRGARVVENAILFTVIVNKEIDEYITLKIHFCVRVRDNQELLIVQDPRECQHPRGKRRCTEMDQM